MTIAEAKQIISDANTSKSAEELKLIKQAICILASSFAIINLENKED